MYLSVCLVLIFTIVFVTYRSEMAYSQEIKESFIHRFARPHIRSVSRHLDNHQSYAKECYQRWLRKLSGYSIF
jgi:hypothetical protein